MVSQIKVTGIRLKLIFFSNNSKSRHRHPRHRVAAVKGKNKNKNHAGKVEQAKVNFIPIVLEQESSY